MRNFGAAQRMTSIMERMGMEDGEALEHRWLNRSIETAQKRVEQRDYRGRKHILEYDDVMNQQRSVVYGYRNEVLQSDNPRYLIEELIDETLPNKVYHYLEERDAGSPDYAELINWVNTAFPLNLTLESSGFHDRDTQGNIDFLIQEVKKAYATKIEHEDPERLDQLERHIIMSGIDKQWKDHLYGMDSLREGINFRAQGQKDPLVEYKNEAYTLFSTLMESIKEESLGNLFRTTTAPVNEFQQFLDHFNLPSDISEEEFQQFLQDQQTEQQQQAEAQPAQVSQANIGQAVGASLSATPLSEEKKVFFIYLKTFYIRY